MARRCIGQRRANWTRKLSGTLHVASGTAESFWTFRNGDRLKPEPNHDLDRYRCDHPELGKSPDGVSWGYFEIPTGAGALRVVSSGGVHDESEGWEHVSISLAHRCPRWEEMCRIKNLFWSVDECVVQFHPPERDYINRHPFVLHLWKPPYPTPLPPRVFV